MANPFYKSITAAGTYAFYPDILQSPFNLSYAVEFKAATTGSYTVSYTLDDPNPNVGDAEFGWTSIWVADPTNGSAQTATQGGFYTFPIRGLRVVVSAVTGQIMFAVIQGQSSR